MTKFRGKEQHDALSFWALAKNLVYIHLYVIEILPPFGRLNDIEKGFSLKIAIVIAPKLGQNHLVLSLLEAVLKSYKSKQILIFPIKKGNDILVNTKLSSWASRRICIYQLALYRFFTSFRMTKSVKKYIVSEFYPKLSPLIPNSLYICKLNLKL